MTQIVACIDGSVMSGAVCDAAAWVSQRAQAPLKLLHVLEKNDVPAAATLAGNIGLGSRENLLLELAELDEKRNKLALEHGRDLLDDAEIRSKANGAIEVTKQQRHGHLLNTLIEGQDDIRLLVIGRQGNSHKPLAHTIGSHLDDVIRSLHKPILVAINDFKAPQSFMVAFDGSEAAQRALDAYANSSLLVGLPCHLVMVGHDDDAHQQKLESAAALLRRCDFEVTVARLSGDVQSALAAYQAEHDIGLIVMGAYGHSRIRQFFVGSHTRKMVSESQIPLLLLR